MTFREAFLFAVDANPKARRGNAKALDRARKADIQNRRVQRHWASAEKIVVRWYRRNYGDPPRDKAGAIDWSQLIQVLIDNLPAIIQLLVTIIALF
jgi:hypothetical protein